MAQRYEDDDQRMRSYRSDRDDDRGMAGGMRGRSREQSWRGSAGEGGFDDMHDRQRGASRWSEDEEDYRSGRADWPQGGYRDNGRQGGREHERSAGGLSYGQGYYDRGGAQPRGAWPTGQGGSAGGGYGYGGSYGNGGTGSGDRQDRRMGHDQHYQSWRDRQMQAHDDDFKAFNEERQKKFDSEFEDWRKNRGSSALGQGGSVTGASGRAGESASREDGTSSKKT